MTNKDFDESLMLFCFLCLAILIAIGFGLEEVSDNKHHVELMEQIKGCTTQTQVK
jgi:hypothetical protein